MKKVPSKRQAEAFAEEEEMETIDTTAQNSIAQRDRDLFNLDGNDHEEQSDDEEDMDLSQLEPSKVNWFKYILDKHLRTKDDEGNSSALNTADAYVNLLNILLTTKKNDEIQGELLDLVGYHNFELLEKLIERREIIRD